MPMEIVMPKLGLTMTEGLIVEWKFKEGDTVEKGEVIFILETEKVTYEVEAPESGILARIVVPENETVAVGAVVGYLARPGEDLSELPPPGEPGDAPKPPVDRESKPPPADPAAAPSPPPEGASGNRPKASPLARKVARKLDVDLTRVRGTGPGGRIVRADVEKAAESRRTESGPPADADRRAPAETVVPLNGMRRAIAQKMLATKVETAQTYMSVTVDAGNIVSHRKTLLPEIEKSQGVRVTITDIVMKIAGAAVRKHPVINTRWTDEGIAYLRDVHMGMAMALDQGLIVPVIRHINEKSFARVAADRIELIRKGKENRFLPDDISGSTFTVSAMGMFGIEQFTSNINLPETAILAVGAIIEKPVAVEGQVVIRPMMTVTLSYDHRVIDGAEAGKFMQTLSTYLEAPILIFA